MAHARKDTLVAPPEWWDHLRHLKRKVSHAERQAAAAEIREQLKERTEPEQQ